jgi:integrase
MAQSTVGLLKRYRADGTYVWHIDKRVKRYGRLCESTGTGDREEAERYLMLAPLPHFGDHLTLAVLFSMNTGLRRGELLKLRWGSVDFNRQLLTVEGGHAKSRQTRHLPLNAEAISLLRRWREQSGGQHVFGVSTGFKTAWPHILKRARITRFRWHDLRHHFASRLVHPARSTAQHRP